MGKQAKDNNKKISNSTQSAYKTQEALESSQVSKLDFKRLNNIGGWSAFVVALLTYWLTLEPTASFWDCGEFIACSYKLQVPHPPGAPFYLLLGRLFSMFATDLTNVAYLINFASALYSAFSILFLFWTITLLGIKITPHKSIKKLTDSEIIMLLGGALVGSLVYTFSDSFWFSAVEAEVYALSSLFTSFVIWAMLKWEHIEDPNYANRWLILIAYVMGLSIGVHLLSLVTIPALALIYYYKKYEKPNTIGVLIALAVGGFIVIFIQNGIIPNLPSLALIIELTFVNTFGLPFGSGVIFLLILIVVGLTFSIRYSIQKEKVVLNTALLSLVFVLMGYATYGIALVRSNYNPPINENDPSDIIKFISYLKREQYGDRPLLYGPTFNSEVKRAEDGVTPVQVSKGKIYRINKEKGKYEDYYEKLSYDYENKMLLPRVYSRQENHEQLYMRMLGISEQDLYVYDETGYPTGKNPDIPNFAQNIQFMFKRQFGHMYFRYFMWNFAGRESDIQDADWIHGFESEESLPTSIKENKARNKYYLLPLLLGLVGLFFLAMRSQQAFFITLMLFFLTGIALVLYLNSPPVEPRERDYIYVGSYAIFAIWIGFGTMFLADLLKSVVKNVRLAPILATVLGLLVPAVMVAQNWDDHNRSGRYHSIDSAKNLLASCDENAIIFTGGDNDTFPLWYVQEVEGFRTDVRVCNLSLLGTDWYIDQMKRQTYESEPLPISLHKDRYLTGRNDQILHPLAWRIQSAYSKSQLEKLERQGMDLEKYIAAINANDKNVRGIYQSSKQEELTILPSRNLVYKFDKENAIKYGDVPKDKQSLVRDNIAWSLAADSVRQRAGFKHYDDFIKPHLLIFDMITQNNWKRPIYFSSTLGTENYLNLKEYLQLEGLAYRLMPFKVAGANQGFVNTDLMYKNMLENFHYRALDNENLYYDENYERFPVSLRQSFYRLCKTLIREDKKKKAKKAVLFSLKKIPVDVFPLDSYYDSDLFDILLELGEKKKALDLMRKTAKISKEELDHAFAEGRSGTEVDRHIYGLRYMILTLEAAGEKKEAKKFEKIFIKYTQMFNEQ